MNHRAQADRAYAQAGFAKCSILHRIHSKPARLVVASGDQRNGADFRLAVRHAMVKANLCIDNPGVIPYILVVTLP